MLYEPTRFDALIDEPWVPARVEDAIAAIVADADAAFDPDGALARTRVGCAGEAAAAIRPVRRCGRRDLGTR